MSELQTKRELNVVDAGCAVVIRYLNGEELIKREIIETTLFTKLEKELKRNLIQLTATRFSLRAEVVEKTDICKLLWQELSSTNCVAFFCLDSISEEAYAKLYDNMDHVPDECGVCFGPCENADARQSDASSLGNCVRCDPVLLPPLPPAFFKLTLPLRDGFRTGFRCPLCKIYINGQPVCYACIDWENDTFVVTDATRQRMNLLGQGSH